MRHFALLRLRHRFACSLAAAALLAACGDDETGSDEESSPTDTDASGEASPSEPAPGSAEALSDAGGQACSAMAAWVELESAAACGQALPCNEALAADCHELVGLVSPVYADAVAGCVDAEHSPVECAIDALGEVEPSPAHLAFAARFCDECALDVPGCQDAFYFDDDGYGIGTVLLPFDETFVNELAEACTESFFCATELPSCVEEQLLEVLEADKTSECLVDTLSDPALAIELLDGCE